MDVRLSAEQRALRDAAAQLVDRLGPTSVAELDDAERRSKLDAALAATGWRELRIAGDDGAPLASVVDVALVAEELSRGLADAAFLGPTLAVELRRLAGLSEATAPETVVLRPDLGTLADGDGIAIDAAGSGLETKASIDLTRPEALVGDHRAPELHDEALARWHAVGLALTSAELVGAMRGALALAVAYAKVRRQYGAPIGSYQAVQHLLADAYVAQEGSRSIARHAAWAADALPADEALVAASIAKAYCARAARTVCETSIQVHGGIGNTWECLAHVYLRRALLSTDVLGGVGPSLERVLDGLR